MKSELSNVDTTAFTAALALSSRFYTFIEPEISKMIIMFFFPAVAFTYQGLNLGS